MIFSEGNFPYSAIALFLIQYFFISAHSVSQTFPIIRNSKCYWSSCFLNKVNTTNICGSNREIRINQGCYVGDKKHNVIGLQYFCCYKEDSHTGKKKKCEASHGPEEPEEDFWWPDNDGVWTRASTNCVFPDIVAIFNQYPIRFYLYTAKNSNLFDNDPLTDDEEILQRSRFITGAPVKIVTHGFMSNGTRGPTRYVREFYNKLPDPINIISVNWEELAALTLIRVPCYNLAARLTRLVGRRTAELMKFLIEQKVTTIKDIHVMGHSLGAHCSGFNCKAFANYSMGRCSRITGFDPAGPLFNNADPSERIDYTDADFVDIIHTATTDADIIPGSLVRTLELGLVEQVGHADFYPNKGGHQPGCQFDKFPISNPACSHMRSYLFYAESIKPPSPKVFKGTVCATVDEALAGECNGPKDTLMGEYTRINNKTRRIYYLETNAESPYAKDDP